MNDIELIRDSDADKPEELMWQGKFIAAKRRGRWEYAARARGIRAAAIIAIDEDTNGTRYAIFVSQYRVPMGRFCLEVTAGLVGDDEGAEGEAAIDAAARELEEETGYRAGHLEELGEFYSSPGMVSESFTLLRATGLTKVGPGGGTESENINIHRVALSQVPDFVADWRAAGHAVDVRIALFMNYLGEDQT